MPVRLHGDTVSVVRADRFVQTKEPISHRAEDQCPQQILLEAFDVRDRIEEVFARALPNERIRNNNRRRIRGRPPEWSEVDNCGRQVVVEQHIAGEVAMDELASSRDRLERRGKPREMLDVRELVRG